DLIVTGVQTCALPIWAFERADPGHDRRVQVGQRGGGDARGEGGGVELVVGVKDQRDVEGLGGQLRRLLAAQHAEEVGGQRELRRSEERRVGKEWRGWS